MINNSSRNSMRLAALCALGLLASCASTRMDAEWSDPQFKGKTLNGKKVLIACRAREETTERLCEDQFALRLAATGAIPIRSYDSKGAAPGPQATAEAFLPDAKSVNAEAIVSVTISAAGPGAADTGPTVGIGVGGFSGRVGTAAAVSLPVGDPKAPQARAADTSLLDVATKRLMWSGHAASPANDDVARQLRELTNVTIVALNKAGLL